MCLACMESSQARLDCSIQLSAGAQTARGIECKQEVPPTPREARTAILAIWVWRVRRIIRRKCRFSDLLLAAVSRASHDRTAKTAKKAISAISVWRVYVPQWTANLTILARNSPKDSNARSAATHPVPIDWHFCKCAFVIPRWLPSRVAQTLMEESREQNKKGDLNIWRPQDSQPPLYQTPPLSSPENFTAWNRRAQTPPEE